MIIYSSVQVCQLLNLEQKNESWACGPIASPHMSSWCPFLHPQLTWPYTTQIRYDSISLFSQHTNIWEPHGSNFGLASRGGYRKWHLLKRDWIARPEHDNHSRLNNQHNRRDLCDPLTSTKTFTSITNEILIWAPKLMRKVATALDLDLLTILY